MMQSSGHSSSPQVFSQIIGGHSEPMTQHDVSPAGAIVTCRWNFCTPRGWFGRWQVWLHPPNGVHPLTMQSWKSASFAFFLAVRREGRVRCNQLLIGGQTDCDDTADLLL